MRLERILVLAGVVILVVVGLVFVVESQTGKSPSNKHDPTASTLPVAGVGPFPPTTIGASQRPLLAPLAPQEIVATNGPGLTGASVTWQPPSSAGGGPIINYVVQIFDVTVSPPVVTGALSTSCGPCTHMSFPALIAGQQYRFAVYAVNSFGPGPPAGSNSLVIVGYPTSPQDISAQAGTAPHTIDVIWYPPDNNGGSPILGYLVQMYNVGGTVPSFVESQMPCGTCTTTTFANVAPGNYQFAVSSRTSVGYSKAAPSNDVTLG